MKRREAQQLVRREQGVQQFLSQASGHMTIDITREQLLLLRDVPGYLHKRGLGKRVHRSVVYRWVMTGCDGVRLETVKIGGNMVTSAEAIQRWVEARAAKERSERSEQVHAARPTLGRGRRRRLSAAFDDGTARRRAEKSTH